MIDIAFRLLEKGIDKIWPDETEAKAAKARLAELALNGELKELDNEFQLALGQLRINEKEAENSDIFVSGWRPFIGWVCGGAFAWNYLVRDFMVMLATFAGAEIPPELLIKLDLSEMMPVLLGMLGLGGYRSYEKMKGVARSKL